MGPGAGRPSALEVMRPDTRHGTNPALFVGLALRLTPAPVADDAPVLELSPRSAFGGGCRHRVRDLPEFLVGGVLCDNDRRLRISPFRIPLGSVGAQKEPGHDHYGR